jgi:hypothetical protein
VNPRLFALTLALLLIPALCHADRVLERSISTGTQCYESLNYGCAINKLREAALRVEEQDLVLDEATAIRLYQTLAFALASVEKHTEAAEAFGHCFRVQPAYRLDPEVISPKIYQDYQVARRAALAGLLDEPLRTPQTPPVYPERPVHVADLQLHTGVLAPGLELSERPSHQLNFLAGPQLLFGQDAEQFELGFNVGVAYLYAVHSFVDVGVIGLFSQHSYAGADLKGGASGTLYVVQTGATVSGAFPLGEYVELSVGLVAGASLGGLANLEESLGGWVGGRFAAMVTPLPRFGVGIELLPGVVVAKLSNGELGTSLTLPLSLRLQARF